MKLNLNSTISVFIFQEERSKVDDLRGTPMSVGTLEEIIDDNHAIVSTSVGSEHYVSILSFVDKDQLEPGCSVLLNHKVGLACSDSTNAHTFYHSSFFSSHDFFNINSSPVTKWVLSLIVQIYYPNHVIRKRDVMDIRLLLVCGQMAAIRYPNIRLNKISIYLKY